MRASLIYFRYPSVGRRKWEEEEEEEERTWGKQIKTEEIGCSSGKKCGDKIMYIWIGESRHF